MISIDDGKVRMVGTIVDLTADMCTLLYDFYEMVKEDSNKELADRMLVLVGKMTMLEPWNDSDADDELGKEFNDILEKMVMIKVRKGIE